MNTTNVIVYAVGFFLGCIISAVIVSIYAKNTKKSNDDIQMQIAEYWRNKYYEASVPLLFKVLSKKYSTEDFATYFRKILTVMNTDVFKFETDRYEDLQNFCSYVYNAANDLKDDQDNEQM